MESAGPDGWDSPQLILLICSVDGCSWIAPSAGERLKELDVCIISGVCFSMKDAYFSPLTLYSVPDFFTVAEEAAQGTCY